MYGQTKRDSRSTANNTRWTLLRECKNRNLIPDEVDGRLLKISTLDGILGGTINISTIKELLGRQKKESNKIVITPTLLTKSKKAKSNGSAFKKKFNLANGVSMNIEIKFI